MPCANCGRPYEEHQSGLAYRDFTGAGTECGDYVEKTKAVEPTEWERLFGRGNCEKCGVPTKFYERPDLCLKCDVSAARRAEGLAYGPKAGK